MERWPSGQVSLATALIYNVAFGIIYPRQVFPMRICFHLLNVCVSLHLYNSLQSVRMAPYLLNMCWVKCETLLFALWTHFLMQFWPMTNFMPLEIKWNVTDLIIWAFFFFPTIGFHSLISYTNFPLRHTLTNTGYIPNCILT